MTAFARELLCEVIQEVQPLLQLHYEELTPRKDLRRLNPQWQEYALLERLERYAVFTARAEGELIGYSGFHVLRHLHDRDFAMAQNDVFYLRPEHRRGTTALGFLHFSEDQLVALPVRCIAYFACPGNNLAPILHRLHYQDEQVMLTKYFDAAAAAQRS